MPLETKKKLSLTFSVLDRRPKFYDHSRVSKFRLCQIEHNVINSCLHKIHRFNLNNQHFYDTCFTIFYPTALATAEVENCAYGPTLNFFFFLFQLAEIGVFDRVDQHETRLNNLEKTNICILSKDPGNCKGTIPR